MKIKNIVIAGKNNIAIEILRYLLNNYNYNVFTIFNSNDHGVDGFQRSFRRYCKILKIPEYTLEQAQNDEHSIFLSLEFDKIISPSLFKHDRIFNIHFSLLPKYKGMFTSALPILHGEAYTGVTLHEIDSGIDTGDIIAQQKILIDDNDTAYKLYLKYIKYGTELVKQNLNNIVSGDYSKQTQQSLGSTYYSKKSINYNDLIIDFKQTAFQVKNMINAFIFRPYQLPKISGENIVKSEITNTKSRLKPGMIVQDDFWKFTISTIDYDVLLYKDRLEFIFDCIRDGKTSDVCKAITINPDIVLEKNDKGWSLIIVAAFYGRKEIIEHLLMCGANINDVNYNGTSVFMYAKDYSNKSGHLDFLGYLINKGADITMKDYNDKTVLCYLNNKDIAFKYIKAEYDKLS